MVERRQSKVRFLSSVPKTNGKTAKTRRAIGIDPGYLEGAAALVSVGEEGPHIERILNWKRSPPKAKATIRPRRAEVKVEIYQGGFLNVGYLLQEVLSWKREGDVIAIEQIANYGAKRGFIKLAESAGWWAALGQAERPHYARWFPRVTGVPGSTDAKTANAAIFGCIFGDPVKGRRTVVDWRATHDPEAVDLLDINSHTADAIGIAAYALGYRLMP